MHKQLHSLNDGDNHSAGTTPGNSGEINLIGTNSSGGIAELTAESPGAASTTSKAVVRAADGHIKVPTSGQDSDEVLSRQQVESMVSEGIWKNPAFHSAVAEHTSSSVGDGGSGGHALAVNDVVLNTTDNKYYTVTSITGGTTGDLVTWDSGTLPTSAEIRLCELSDSEWVFDADTSTWIDKGSSSHARQHSITSTSDHTAGTWKVFHSDGSGGVVELALGAANAPLLSGGASAAPIFGSLLLASGIVSAAGEYPADTDVTSWANNTVGIVVGTTGLVFIAFKNATDVYYVEMTAS